MDSAAGYATGTVVHADALRAGKNAVVNLDVAFSGAAFSQKPAPAPFENEVQRLVAHLDTKKALGRGTARTRAAVRSETPDREAVEGGGSGFHRAHHQPGRPNPHPGHRLRRVAHCNVPGLVGMTEAEARTKVEQAGCILVVEPKNTSDQSKLGKVISQDPGADAVVPRGSNVTVGIGVQVLGDTLTNGQEVAAAPNLARTGGLFLGGLSLWLLVGGLAARGAGSKRLWRLARRRNG